MRLRLTIQRNRLPPVKTWFAIDASADPPPTISKLLEQVNELVPLEAENWGLEDYVVTIGGFECLHYSRVKDVVKENDRLCIRPLSTPERRTRTLSGRYQINASGQHLTDGIPFGRSLIRHPNRPAVHIPPRKRPRLADADDEAGSDEVIQALVVRDATNDADDGSDSGEEDDDFEPGDSDDESAESEDDAGDDIYNSLPASDRVSVLASGGKKRRRSVSFSKVVDVENENHSILTGSSSSQDEDTSDDSWGAISSDSDAASSDESGFDAGGPDEGNNAGTRESSSDDTDSDDTDTSSEATSEEEEDSSASSAEKQLQAESEQGLPTTAALGSSGGADISKPPVPPGEGKRETQKRNLRRRQKKRLFNLIKTGQLPPNATVSDLEALSETNTGTQTNQAKHKQAAANNDLEVQRQRLLKQLQEGGVDVTVDMAPIVPADVPALKGDSLLDGHSEPQTPNMNDGGTGDDLNDVVEHKRPRLNLASSNRLIFGSLGVRTPKTKEDNEKVRDRLAGRSQLKSAIGASASDTSKVDEGIAASRDPPADFLSDAWRSKIKLKAVECIDEGVALSEPPYPFIQCWDEQYAWNRPQDKKKRRKRKRQSQVEDAEEAGEEDYSGWTEDMYDDNGDGISEPISDTIPHNHGGEHYDEADDFPPMPSDISALPAIAAQHCDPGSYVLLKELHVDASTKWQPEISDWRLAHVIENEGADGLNIILAPQHRRAELVEYDNDGKRVRQGFEMPASDEEEDGDGDGQKVDEGYREIALESLMEIRLVKGVEPVDEGTIEGLDVVPEQNGAASHDADDDSEIVWNGIGAEAEDAL